MSESLQAMIPFDRRAFLGGSIALGALHSVPLGARGPAFYPAPDRQAMIEVPGGRIDGPHTLFIHGQHDEARAVTPAAFAARVPGAEFAVIPGTPHGFLADRPEEALGILRPWLRRQDRL